MKGKKNWVHSLPTETPYAPVRSDDPVTRHPRRERVVPQRVPHGARRRSQVVRKGEVGRVGTRGHLAEGAQDASAEGRQGRVRGDVGGNGRVDWRGRWRFGWGRRRGAHGGSDVALLSSLLAPCYCFLGFLLRVRRSSAVGRHVLSLPLLLLLLALERLASNRQTPPVQFHQINLPLGNGFAELDARFQLPCAHVLDRGRLQLRGPRRGCFVLAGGG